jgi:hypothetical protein
MLLSKTQEEWDEAYECTTLVAQSKPKMLSALNYIHSDTERYAGFYLRGIEGNLYINGDVSAEKNHSGVVAYLGMGAVSICYHRATLTKF